MGDPVLKIKVPLRPEIRLVPNPLGTPPFELPNIPAANTDVEFIEGFAQKFLRVGGKVLGHAFFYAQFLGIEGDNPTRTPIIDQPPQGKTVPQWLNEIEEATRISIDIANKLEEIDRYKINNQSYLVQHAEQELEQLLAYAQTIAQSHGAPVVNGALKMVASVASLTETPAVQAALQVAQEDRRSDEHRALQLLGWKRFVLLMQALDQGEAFQSVSPELITDLIAVYAMYPRFSATDAALYTRVRLLIEQLGPQAASAIPVVLQKITQSFNKEERQLHAKTLAQLGPKAMQLVPEFMARILRTDVLKRRDAVQVLEVMLSFTFPKQEVRLADILLADFQESTADPQKIRHQLDVVEVMAFLHEEGIGILDSLVPLGPTLHPDVQLELIKNLCLCSPGVKEAAIPWLLDVALQTVGEGGGIFKSTIHVLGVIDESELQTVVERLQPRIATTTGRTLQSLIQALSLLQEDGADISELLPDLAAAFLKTKNRLVQVAIANLFQEWFLDGNKENVATPLNRMLRVLQAFGTLTSVEMPLRKGLPYAKSPAEFARILKIPQEDVNRYVAAIADMEPAIYQSVGDKCYADLKFHQRLMRVMKSLERHGVPRVGEALRRIRTMRGPDID